ncbi:Aste57867_14072 [Aphanomyces stellatus]|uniref:Aste57867_14072 protein n=1 Tax=Aphanomyces stellatus TaxID=120398 RepID=A0A485KZU6_9STRA|nr:hypothetical protein As57867_014021 [Aphanomyces stellatus]VFT90900.1 Aste57867_14072 [Aphanomyces stellatus]
MSRHNPRTRTPLGGAVPCPADAHPKYRDMLHKTTGELTFVGFIYLGIKFCVCVGLVVHDNIAYNALDAADLLVFFTTLSLVL